MCVLKGVNMEKSVVWNCCGGEPISIVEEEKVLLLEVYRWQCDLIDHYYYCDQTNSIQREVCIVIII